MLTTISAGFCKKDLAFGGSRSAISVKVKQEFSAKYLNTSCRKRHYNVKYNDKKHAVGTHSTQNLRL